MKRRAYLGFFAIAFFLSASFVSAQSERAVRVNLVSTSEAQEEMLLKLYFTLYDPSTQKTITNLNVDEAQITLQSSGYISPAVIQEPDIPIYVTLLLDASGSMAGSAQQLRDAANVALENPPEDALFGVVQFNEKIELLQDFSDNVPAIQLAINQYAVADSGTCLYDASYAAVEAQASAPPGRRAVILFTDGKDEIQAGQACSKHNFKDLVDLALETQVSIHTIGLTGSNSNINEVELKNLADITGGFSFIANQVDLPGAFSQIMEALDAQWMAEAVVYPKDGANNGLLSLIFVDEAPLNAEFSFESGTGYPGPPSPVQARLDGLQLIAETQSYDLQMTLTSSELIAYVKVALWDQDTGAKVADYIFDDPVSFNSFIIPTDKMVADRKYELRITAISAADNVPFMIHTDSRGESTSEIIHEFRFDLSSIFASAEIASVTQESGDLVLNVSLTNPGMIGGFKGWLVDQNTNTLVANSEFTLPASEGNEGEIKISMRENRVVSGVYTIILQVLNTNQEVLMSTQYEDVTYQAPNIFQRISLALITEPVFLIAIIGIILGVIFFLIVMTSRQKSLTGTPVMQGQLGSNKKSGKRSRGISALAAKEPLDVDHLSGKSSYKGEKYRPQKGVSQTVEPAATVLHNMPGTNAQVFVQMTKGPSPGRYMIEDFPFVIGRGECDLTIGEVSISRKHAEITKDGKNNYYITDLNSSNGTRLNGQLLKAGQKIPIGNESQIDLGNNVSLYFEVK